jgi:hypothetical protein
MLEMDMAGVIGLPSLFFLFSFFLFLLSRVPLLLDEARDRAPLDDPPELWGDVEPAARLMRSAGSTSRTLRLEPLEPPESLDLTDFTDGEGDGEPPTRMFPLELDLEFGLDSDPELSLLLDLS